MYRLIIVSLLIIVTVNLSSSLVITIGYPVLDATFLYTDKLPKVRSFH